ncbi:5-methylcytosine restriction system specificity protein McrC [Sphingobacterium corticibacterium]|uniref:Restriction endonuclease n=1 Tax=Sphingobacterium corticibacterium TaxID=2484746 RepID=A0A4Q6XQH1_9SPHI|nr:restriction endonuclease [Sphingobacterium corticibacterium]RZF62201.1 restriction endonuclease [Sphingobacterium corticibacterium]
MGFVLREHIRGEILRNDEITESHFDTNSGKLSLAADVFLQYRNLRSKLFRPRQNCYEVSHFKEENRIVIQPGYFIGVDWLLRGERYIQVEPKVNSKTTKFFNDQTNVAEEDVESAERNEEQAEQELTDIKGEFKEINFLKMILEVMADATVSKECGDLVKIEWDEICVPISQEQDQLTPFLVVQYLQLLQRIVRKGLKKSYYNVQENLSNRVKGKILVSEQIKNNILRNRLTQTHCSYQQFGEDSIENRFLKKVLSFVASYVENNKDIFRSNEGAILHLVNYARPSFEHVGNQIAEEQLRHLKHNPFFKEYKEAIQIGQYILKRFAFNITQTTEKKVKTPPFWIDMPLLFELYVYQKLLQANGNDTGKIRYQFSTYGNALDILVKNGNYSMIIDAKYKLHYKHSHIHQDIRQVAGYARLNRVREELEIKDDRHIDCLIVYPDLESGIDLEDLNELKKKFSLDAIKRAFSATKNQVPVYHKVYKIGVRLPIL